MAHFRLSPGPAQASPTGGPHTGDAVDLGPAKGFRIELRMLGAAGVALDRQGTEEAAGQGEHRMRLGSLGPTGAPAIETRAVDCPLRYVRYRVYGVGDAGAAFDVEGATT